jgi:hypothetical protein
MEADLGSIGRVLLELGLPYRARESDDHLRAKEFETLQQWRFSLTTDSLCQIRINKWVGRAPPEIEAEDLEKGETRRRSVVVLKICGKCLESSLLFR